jgi:magnesium-transporting ATPase (P-type)
MPVKWDLLKTGTLVRVDKDSEFPADMFLLKSSRDSGTAYVHTLNLDGESNLKEKLAVPKI